MDDGRLVGNHSIQYTIKMRGEDSGVDRLSFLPSRPVDAVLRKARLGRVELTETRLA